MFKKCASVVHTATDSNKILSIWYRLTCSGSPCFDHGYVRSDCCVFLLFFVTKLIWRLLPLIYDAYFSRYYIYWYTYQRSEESELSLKCLTWTFPELALYFCAGLHGLDCIGINDRKLICLSATHYAWFLTFLQQIILFKLLNTLSLSPSLSLSVCLCAGSRFHKLKKFRLHSTAS